MSITDKLQTLKNTKQAIKQAIIDKGIEVSDTDAFASYADKITSITANDDGSNNIVTGLTINNFINVDSNNKLIKSTSSDIVCEASDIDDYALAYLNTNNPNITSASFPNLSTLSGTNSLYYAFNECQNLVTVEFPELTIISGDGALSNTFNNTNLVSISFPKLTAISASNAFSYAFYNCSNLETLSFPALKTIAYYGLHWLLKTTTKITSVEFPELETIEESGMDDVFGSNKITSLTFPKLKTLGPMGLYNCCSNISSLDLPTLEGTIYNKSFSIYSLKKIWLPKEVTTLKAASNLSSASYNYYYSPFYSCNSNLIIYTDAPEKLEGWSDYCFHISSNTEATVIYGATHEDFENG